MWSCGARGRENVVVIADEARRSQCGFGGRVNAQSELSYGFASNLRDAFSRAIAARKRPTSTTSPYDSLSSGERAGMHCH